MNLAYDLSDIDYQIFEILDEAAENEGEISEASESRLVLLKCEKEALIMKAVQYLELLDDDVSILDDRIKSYQERKRTLSARNQKLKDYLIDYMQEHDYTKIHRPEGDISIKKNPPKVNVVAEDRIPEEYFEVKTEIKLNKKLLLDKLKQGIEVDGAVMEQGQSLSYKIKK